MLAGALVGGVGPPETRVSAQEAFPAGSAIRSRIAAPALPHALGMSVPDTVRAMRPACKPTSPSSAYRRS
jgi:hypothetical protein